MSIALALVAMLVELCCGYPERLFEAIGHPVSWMRRLIAALDDGLDREEAAAGSRRRAGVLAVFCLLVVVGAVALAVQEELLRLPFGTIAAGVLASTLVAQRSLHRHVAAVADALEKGGVGSGRAAAARILGRDAEQLDAAAIARAAIDSLAANFSEGIVAPVVWMVIAGLPGAALYKAINTAADMIGQRTPRHADFGWAATRLDALVELPASRLSALALVAAAALNKDASPGAAWRALRRDGGRDRSPNAGYPEAVMAGALGLSLAGRRNADHADIRRALALFRSADAIVIALLAAAALFLIAPM